MSAEGYPLLDFEQQAADVPLITPPLSRAIVKGTAWQ